MFIMLGNGLQNSSRVSCRYAIRRDVVGDDGAYPMTKGVALLWFSDTKLLYFVEKNKLCLY